ncbi:MAG: dTMP kinase, partial [Patescibacteria group bacterium]
MLVLFEGNDGCGKSSTAKIFAEWLEKEFPEIPVQQLYEPGSGSLGPTLREILKHSSQPIVPAAELFLFLASRAQLMKQGIISAIQAGEIVVLDRSTLSSLAYQVAGCGLDPTLALPAIELATCGVVPDITFVLKASPEVVRMRNPNKQPDRIEARGEEFNARVSRGFECFADLLKHR